MGIVVVRSPKCLRGLLRRIFGVRYALRGEKAVIHFAVLSYGVTKPGPRSAGLTP